MPHISRRAVVGGIGALGALGAASYGANLFGSREPSGSRGVDMAAPVPQGRGDLNLLVLMVDQERSWETLPASLDLPNHHRIASRGTSFTKMNVTSPLCTPSRSVFWTGQHVQHTKVQDNSNVPLMGRPLDPAIPTLGHMLREAGFYTAYKGKWHLHELPKDPAWEIAPLRSDALEPYGYSDYGWGPELIDTQDGWKYDGRIARDAVEWLTNKATTLDQPWALTVSFVNPHDIMFFDATGEQAQLRVQNTVPGPVRPAPDDPLYASAGRFGLPRDFPPTGAAGQVPAQADYERFMDAFYGPIPHGNVEAWIRFSEYYYNCIRDVDRHLGTVLDALERNGQADNTIVILVSDHGEMGGVHGLRQKGPWMYRENLNVPFVVSHPDARTPRVNSGLVSAVDFAPTVLGLAGLDRRDVESRYTAISGADISADLTASSTDRSRLDVGALVTYSVSHHADPEFAETALRNQTIDSGLERLANSIRSGLFPSFDARSFMRGIVTDNFKFARYFSPRDHHRPDTMDDLTRRNDLELFDLREDPGETRNLAAGDELPADLITRLNASLNALLDTEVGPDDGRDMPGPRVFWRG